MSDIAKALELIRSRLNAFISDADARREWVILSNLAGRNGAPYEGATDKLVMSLANIHREDVVGSYSPVPAGGGNPVTVAPPLYIDLYLLFYANFADSAYSEGLRVISRTLSFFQQNPSFTHDNLPGLDPVIDKLTFELVNLGIVELERLMGMLGVHYLPSVYYKLRLIPFIGGAAGASGGA